MKLISVLTIIIGFLIFFSGVVKIIYDETYSSNEIEYTKCYDRYSNEIIGQQCIEDSDSIGYLIILMSMIWTISLIPLSLRYNYGGY